MYFLVCFLQIILPTAPRDMCVRMHPLFFITVYVVSRSGSVQYGIFHAKNPMRSVMFILQHMWKEIFFIEQPGIENFVECMCSVLLVQPDSGGVDGFFSKPTNSIS